MEQMKSKSQKKREADARQDLGVALIDLRIDQIKKLLLPPPLEQAILGAKKLTSHGAVRRQAQWIGKLMRNMDVASLLAQYVSMYSGNKTLLLKRFHLLIEDVPRENDDLVDEDDEAFADEGEIDDIVQEEDVLEDSVGMTLEQWCDRLIAGDKAVLTEFIDFYHPENIQHVRHLIQHAQKAVSVEQKNNAHAKLLSYLRIL